MAWMGNKSRMEVRGHMADGIHEESTIVIMHGHNPLGKEIPRMLQGGVTGLVHKLTVDVEIGSNFLDSVDRFDGYARKAFGTLARARRSVERAGGSVALTAGDIPRAKREGKAAIILGNEGGKLLEGDPDMLREFHRLGLREIQLSWAAPNQIYRHRPSEMGLTDFGRDVVREMNRLGMVIDLSHLTSEAFAEVLEVTRDPVVVSHGSPGVEQPLELHRAMCDRGGVFGQHFYYSYLSWRAMARGSEHVGVEDLLDAIDFAVDQLGIDHVALGGDYFPSSGRWASFQRAQGTRNIEWAIADISRMPELTRGLVLRGYADGEIRKILGGNVIRLYERVLGA